MSRVEKLHVNFTGQDVEAGQTLAELYSPELYQAIQELLTGPARGAGRPSRRPPLGRSLLGDRQEMVRRRPRSSSAGGSPRPRSTRSSRQGKTDFTFPILSPIGGHVVKKNVVEGQ